MEDKNLLLEEVPGASPAEHLAARGEYVSAGFSARWVNPVDGALEWEPVWDTREQANDHINSRILDLLDSGLPVGEFHLVEIFLKG